MVTPGWGNAEIVAELSWLNTQAQRLDRRELSVDFNLGQLTYGKVKVADLVRDH